ncbi:hypothetical protein LPJ66_007565 [Kickxella alabastrina]|uniref:Uncharacterized protein n=1 Tax=Kickxella alabastrina TaxID=61397 RepID=A0ACC1I8T3_9FUNG|nr:hypothetical protein LPJ66_007565 [Kickxella alabastrina]
MSYSTVSLAGSMTSSTPTLHLDRLRAHHTQALVNIVSNMLYPATIDTHALTKSLVNLRRHLESPLSCAHSHPATDTNAAEVLEHILLCWVCSLASQTDAQNYNFESIVATADGLFDKYAVIPALAVSEAIQCTSYLATMSVGIAAVAKTSIPASLALVLGFAEDHGTFTNAFRALTKLCTKHSVRRAKAGGRWESDNGIYAVMDAFTRAKSALGLRNRFDSMANAAFIFASEMASTGAYMPSPSSPSSEYHRSTTSLSNASSQGSMGSMSSLGSLDRSSQMFGVHAERVVTSALALVNALIDAHGDVGSRLRLREELLDTALYKCLKLVEEPEFEHTRAYVELRRFGRAYSSDINECDPLAPGK